MSATELEIQKPEARPQPGLDDKAGIIPNAPTIPPPPPPDIPTPPAPPPEKTKTVAG